MAKTKEELNELKTENETTNKLNELNKDLLEEIVGGNQPEEFDWKKMGYVTPIKKDPSGSSWKFTAIGNTDGQYFKKITEDSDKDDLLKKIMNIINLIKEIFSIINFKKFRKLF